MNNKKRVSYSQYRMWLGCPLAWKHKYVDDIRLVNDTIHTVFGTAIHRIIQDWLSDCVYAGKSPIYCKTIDLTEDFKNILIEEAGIVFEKLKNSDEEFMFPFTKDELGQFYQQGLEIIKYIQQNQEKIFPTKDVVLHSIEFELTRELSDHIDFQGFVDIITYDTVQDRYHLYDLKSSTRGWSSYQKKDKTKTDQLLLYKKIFSDQFFVPMEKIDVTFVILKRVLPDYNLEHAYENPRVTKYVPANGKISVNKAWNSFETFLTECFDSSGDYIAKQKATPSEFGCKYCDFNADCKFSWENRQNAMTWVEI